MKHKYTIFTKIIITFLFIFLLCSLFSTRKVCAESTPVRGIWISFGDFEAAGLYDQDKEDFCINADKMFSKLAKYGFNTVYFHTRPNDDSIYPDSNFDWCEAISPEPLDYDAFDILIEKSHKYNISFHAWINPYRIDTTHIYNPASDSTTKHIVEGVKEIIKKYPVDGIHFDDYFYPAKHKGNKFYSVSIKDRKENVNKMVKAVYSTIKEYNPAIQFGISPAGNTSYAESIGCDIDTWTTDEGYVDYILPQLYWSDNYVLNGKKTKLYTDTLDEWTDYGTGEVPVYIGLALYKAGQATSYDRGWRKYKNIANQVALSEDYGCSGWVLFSYKFLFTSEGKKEMASYITKISKFRLTTTSRTLKVGKRYNISNKISIKPGFKFKYKYMSINKRIASVSTNGIIKAKRHGTTYIYVTGLSGCKARCKIKVRGN